MKSAPLGAVDAGHECRREPFVPPQPHHMFDAAAAGDIRRPVARSVVYDEDFDDVDARNGSWQVGDGRRQRFGLAEARPDLDDELLHLTHPPVSR